MRTDHYIIESGKLLSIWKQFLNDRKALIEKINVLKKKYHAKTAYIADNSMTAGVAAFVFKGNTAPNGWRKYQGRHAVEKHCVLALPSAKNVEAREEIEALKIPNAGKQIASFLKCERCIIDENSSTLKFLVIGNVGKALVLLVPRQDKQPKLRIAGARSIAHWEFVKIEDSVATMERGVR